MQNHWSKGVGALCNEIMKPDAILLFPVEEISVSILLSETFIIQSFLS